MMTLRRYLIARYDPTGLSSKILLSKKWHVGVISFVFLLVFALVAIYHLYYVKLGPKEFATTPMGVEHMFPTITYFTYGVYLIPLFLMILNAYRMYRCTMRKSGSTKIPYRFWLAEFKTMFVHMFSHSNMRKCTQLASLKRWSKHWLLAFACVLMAICTLFFLKWFQTDNTYPLYHPQRWLGYIATAILIIVPADILWGRVRKRQEMHKFSEFSDWTFPVLLLLTAVSGIGVHILRYLGLSLACHYVYALHLAITVPLLVIEVPLGKWSHMIYRPLAVYFQAVKERAQAAGLLSGEAAA